MKTGDLTYCEKKDLESGLRFKIAFSETKLRWLYTNEPDNKNAIELNKAAIAKTQAELDTLRAAQ